MSSEKKRPATRPSSTSRTAASSRATVASAERRAQTIELLKSVIGAVLIFLFLRAFLVEAYRIPSGSMIPTLLVGDWLFVNKLRYGPRIPLTPWHLPGYAEPVRNDVVVYESPPQSDQPWDPTPTVVKRVIGIGGDTIHMRAGQVYINGIAQHHEAVRRQIPYGVNPGEPSPAFSWQHQFAIQGARMGEPPAQPSLDDWGPLVIPDRHLFMLGDNRYESKDARFYGFVPRENIRGRPLFIYFSCDSRGTGRVFVCLGNVRWSRLGHRIR